MPKHFTKKIWEGSSGTVYEYNIRGKFAAAVKKKSIVNSCQKQKYLKLCISLQLYQTEMLLVFWDIASNFAHLYLHIVIWLFMEK